MNVDMAMSISHTEKKNRNTAEKSIWVEISNINIKSKHKAKPFDSTANSKQILCGA